MSWLWNPWSSPSPSSSSALPPSKARRSLSRQTSVRVAKFQSGKTKGSLVLDKEDLKILKVQGKLEGLQHKLRMERLIQRDELDVLRSAKQTLILQLEQKVQTLDGGLDLAFYQQTIQTEFLQSGMTMAGPEEDGIQEAEILKSIHRSEIFDKSRSLYSSQNSDELMEVYKTIPKVKEEFSEKELRSVDKIFKLDNTTARRIELNEKVLSLQAKLKVELEKGAEEQFQKTYNALREKEDGDLTIRKKSSPVINRANRKHMMMGEKQSYSSRILDSAPLPRSRSPMSPNTREKVADETSINNDETKTTALLEIAIVTANTNTNTPPTSPTHVASRGNPDQVSSTSAAALSSPLRRNQSGTSASTSASTSTRSTAARGRNPMTRSPMTRSPMTKKGPVDINANANANASASAAAAAARRTTGTTRTDPRLPSSRATATTSTTRGTTGGARGSSPRRTNSSARATTSTSTARSTTTSRPKKDNVSPTTWSRNSGTTPSNSSSTRPTGSRTTTTAAAAREARRAAPVSNRATTAAASTSRTRSPMTRRTAGEQRGAGAKGK